MQDDIDRPSLAWRLMGHESEPCSNRLRVRRVIIKMDDYEELAAHISVCNTLGYMLTSIHV